MRMIGERCEEENISIYQRKQHRGRIVLTIRVRSSEGKMRCSVVNNVDDKVSATTCKTCALEDVDDVVPVF